MQFFICINNHRIFGRLPTKWCEIHTDLVEQPTNKLCNHCAMD